jgi:hypothetical protein
MPMINEMPCRPQTVTIVVGGQYHTIPEILDMPDLQEGDTTAFVHEGYLQTYRVIEVCPDALTLELVARRRVARDA